HELVLLRAVRQVLHRHARVRYHVTAARAARAVRVVAVGARRLPPAAELAIRRRIRRPVERAREVGLVVLVALAHLARDGAAHRQVETALALEADDTVVRTGCEHDAVDAREDVDVPRLVLPL